MSRGHDREHGCARPALLADQMTLRVLVSLLLIAVIFWYLLKDISPPRGRPSRP